MLYTSSIINTSVFLRVNVHNPYKVELVDNLIITPQIISLALAPYLDSLFAALSLTNPQRVPRYTFNEVTFGCNLVFGASWIDRREIV